MGNITSFFQDVGDFMADWEIWLVAIIMGWLCKKTVIKSLIGRNIVTGIIMGLIGILLITYISIAILHVWTCWDKHGNDIDFVKLFQDQDYWLETLYQALIFTAFVIAGGVALVKTGWMRLNITGFAFWAITSVGFYMVYKGYQEWFSCKDYLKEDEGDSE